MELTWQRIGAWAGGTVATVALARQRASNHLVLAATAAGIYRSVDGGQTWALHTTGLYDPTLVTVSFAPHLDPNKAEPNNRQDEQRAFVSTSSGRLFTTVDSGETWAEVLAWAGLGVITAFAISPAFVDDGTLFVATGEGIFRSQDGGQHWENSTFGLLDLDVLCLACAPDFASSEVLWAGTAQGGFYRSRNAGRSWRDAGAGLPDTAIQCLTVSPHFAIDQTLFVGTETAGLYRSVDGGASWAAVGETLAEQSINCLAISPLGNQMLAGTSSGVYWSDDSGQSWTASENGEFAALSLDLAEAGKAIAGAVHDGIYLSADGGKSWQPIVSGLAAHDPPVVAQSTRQAWWALDNDGVLAYSPDQGAHWQELAAGIEREITTFAVTDEAETTTLYAVTAEGQLYRAPASGVWERCLDDLDDAPHFTLLSPSPNFAHDQTLALGDEDGQIYLWPVKEHKISNAPAPWQGETLLQIAFSPNYGNDQASNSHTMCAITAQPDAQDNYQIQLWQSLDNAQNWESSAVFHTEIPAVALAWPADASEHAIFLATRNRVIKIFTRAIDQQLVVEQAFLDETISITSLIASRDYAQHQTLYAATNQGVYHSPDNGQSWHALGQGLAERVVVALIPSLDTAALYAVTLGGEVWQLGC